MIIKMENLKTMDGANFEKNIDNFANQNYFTNDTQYNHGLRLIHKYGYVNICENDDVKYYCMCNFLI